jgi:hypothetical protein
MNTLRRLILAMTAWGAMPALAATIAIQPGLTIAGVGETLNFEISIIGAPDLYAYQFDLGFDSSVLSATSVSEGSFLSAKGGTFFFPGLIDNAGGTVSFIAGSLTGPGSGAYGDGLLATLSFTAIGAGASTLGFFNLAGLDSFGEDLSLSTAPATVFVFPTAGSPEPASYFLAGGALLIFALLPAARRLRGRQTNVS